MQRPTLFLVLLALLPVPCRAGDLPLLRYVPNPQVCNYPSALPSLLRTIRQRQLQFPLMEEEVIRNLQALREGRSPLLYINAGDVANWDFPDSDVDALRSFLDSGGFLWIDAGLQADFFTPEQAQAHSYAYWEASEPVHRLFKRMYPTLTLEALPQTHPIFRLIYSGLPSTDKLPAAITPYVTQEKWPQGTYSLLGLTVHHHLGVILTPIASMGWVTDESGRFTGMLAMRIREEAPDLGELLSKTKASGESYLVHDAQGGEETIYCDPPGRPAWVRESSGRWRVFRYYQGPEISTFAQQFFTQLGINVWSYALLGVP